MYHLFSPNENSERDECIGSWAFEVANRIAEETTGPSVNLTYQISRVLDGLGRLQQVTGRE